MQTGEITLSIDVDLAGRKALLATGQQIVVVRLMKGEPEFIVACAVTEPFGDVTAIGFYPLWKAFVSQQVSRGGVTVSSEATQVIAPGQQYPFTAAGFGGVEAAYSPAVFGLINNDAAGSLSAGLLQQLNVADADVWSPIVVTGFPYNETSYFEPADDVLVFVAKGIGVGELFPATMLRPVLHAGPPPTVGPYLLITLTADTTIHFDDAANCFRPGPI